MELRKIQNKKGAIGEVYALIRVLFVIGVFAALALMISTEFRDKSFLSTSGTNTNETLTTVTEAGEDFTVSSYRSISCVIVAVYNATGGEVIGSGNYTQTNCNLASADAEYNNTDWNVTYTYSYKADTAASDGVNDTMYVIKDDLIGWLGIVAIGIIGFALMKYFNSGNKAGQ